MKEREIAERALKAFVDQNAAACMRYFDDDVAYDAPPQVHLEGRFRLFQELALLLTRESGARVTDFTITHVDTAGAPIRWVRATLHVAMTRDGRIFPNGDTDYERRSTEVWFGIRDGKVVAVKALSSAQEWRLTF